jgi:hypothetical protein
LIFSGVFGRIFKKEARMNCEVKAPEIVYIEIVISGGSREEVFDVGKGLQNYLQGLFNNGRFIIKEASFSPYLILFGCPITENIRVMAETLKRIVEGFLQGKGEENGQD